MLIYMLARITCLRREFLFLFLQAFWYRFDMAPGVFFYASDWWLSNNLLLLCMSRTAGQFRCHGFRYISAAHWALHLSSFQETQIYGVVCG